MRPQIVLKGIVLSSGMVGDYDKRVVILTKERGKITAFARNVRKPGNMLMAACQPFNYGSFYVYESYDAYKLVSAQVEEYFSDIKEDLDSVCYGRYFCEFMDYLTMEGNCDKNVLNLLYMSFKALTKKNIPPELVRRIFEIKMLALDGEAIHCFSCVNCNKKEKLDKFDATSSAFLCSECSGKPGTINISETTVYTVQYVISSSVSKLYTFTVTEDIQRELDMICNRYVPTHIDRKFKSLELLEGLHI